MCLLVQNASIEFEATALCRCMSLITRQNEKV